MRSALLLAVRQQYAFHCGYCGISETDNGAALTVDHFQPRSHGGADAFENLVYSCHACNENKGNWWNPGGVERVLHPLNDDLTVHYKAQDDGTLLALTPTGAFHIRWLKLNRPPLILHRLAIHHAEQERAERRETLALLRSMDERLMRVEEAIREQKRGGE